MGLVGGCVYLSRGFSYGSFWCCEKVDLEPVMNLEERRSGEVEEEMYMFVCLCMFDMIFRLWSVELEVGCIYINIPIRNSV